jgi:hypothetical protein
MCSSSTRQHSCVHLVPMVASVLIQYQGGGLCYSGTEPQLCAIPVLKHNPVSIWYSGDLVLVIRCW